MARGTGRAEPPALAIRCARCGKPIRTTRDAKEVGEGEYAHAGGCPTDELKEGS